MNLTNILPIKPISTAVNEALDFVNFERTGIQNGLYTRFPNINQSIGKYFRFGKVYLLAGLSGHGKSYILNMLEDDLTNLTINGNYRGGKKKVILLSFKYEMDAKDEVLRNTSSEMEKSFSYLISSEYDMKSDTYNMVDDMEYEEIKTKMEALRNRNILFVETAGNLTQLYNTFVHVQTLNPDANIIVTIDHIMLSAKLGEKDDLELMSNTAHTAIRLRKLGAMVFLLNQLNGEIEKPLRKTDISLHYPVKIDIHCGNQIYWACDFVIIAHRPELLGIEKYGKNKLPTKKLLHLALIKVRGGLVRNLWFEEHFSQGKIIPFHFKIEEDKTITKIYLKTVKVDDQKK